MNSYIEIIVYFMNDQTGRVSRVGMQHMAVAPNEMQL
jgi:hypothetical protein